MNLARDLGVNIAGIAIVLQMRERMEEMNRQMQGFVDYVRTEMLTRMQDQQPGGAGLVRRRRPVVVLPVHGARGSRRLEFCSGLRSPRLKLRTTSSSAERLEVGMVLRLADSGWWDEMKLVGRVLLWSRRLGTVTSTIYCADGRWRRACAVWRCEAARGREARSADVSSSGEHVEAAARD